jgi:hypothetical protein
LSTLARDVASATVLGRLLWIAMKIAHTTIEVVIRIMNGLIGDFSDFAIAISRRARVGNLTGLPTVRPQIALFGESSPALPDLPSSPETMLPRTTSCLRDGHHFLEFFDQLWLGVSKAELGQKISGPAD